MVVGDIARELQIRGSTLSHHLEKLRQEGLVKVRREGTFLWYSVGTEALRELLDFLYAQCHAPTGTDSAILAANGPQGDLNA